jgi:hypothetical protein
MVVSPVGLDLRGCFFPGEYLEVEALSEVSLDKQKVKPSLMVADEPMVEEMHPPCFARDHHHVPIHASRYVLDEFVRVREMADGTADQRGEFLVKKTLKSPFIFHILGIERGPSERGDRRH